MIEKLAYIGYFFLLLNLIVFLKGFFRNGKAFQIFTIYTGVILIIQLVSTILFKFKINNLFLSHFYFIFQFLLLSLFYYNLLKERFQKKTVALFIFVCPFILIVQYLIHNELFFKFNLFEIFITSFLIIIYSTFHLYNMLNGKRDFYFINLGILIYLFGSTVLFLVGNLMNSLSSELNELTWILNSILYIIYQIFILAEWKKSFS